MKAFYSFIMAMAVLFWAATSHAQLSGNLIHISDDPGQTVSTCGSLLGTNFVDSQADTSYMFGFPVSSSYANNESYTKTICSSNNENITFDFSAFDLGAGDVLEIYDGPDTSSPLITSATGSDSPGYVFSSGTCLTFVFTSDGSDVGAGWSASVNCENLLVMDDPATETTCGDVLYDSGMNGDYGNNEDYVKTICPDGNDCISMSFNLLDIESGSDFLYVYQGNSIDPANLLSTITGNDASQTVSSSEGCLTLHFVSDGSGSNQGWEAVFSCPGLCNVPPCAGGNEAAADACADAPTICDLNGYCGNTSDQYTPDFPGNFCDMNTTNCDLFQGSIENNSWLKFWASSDTAAFHVWVPECSSGSAIQMGIYEGTECDNFILKSDPALTSASQGDMEFIITANGLTVGQTYYIMVDGVGGSVCNYVVAAESGVAFGYTITADHTICNGDQDTIEVTGGENWIWTAIPPDPSLAGQETLQEIYVTPNQTTTYSVEISGGGSSGWTPPDCNAASELSTTVYVEDCSECTTPAFDYVAIAPACNGDHIIVEFTDISLMNNPAYNWNIPADLSIVSGSINTAGPIELSYNGTGSYTISLQITDNDGSQDCAPYTASNTIVIPEQLNTSGNVQDESIPGACDGAIDLTVDGGTAPHTIAWSNNQTVEDIEDLCPDNYSVTVTDDNGCTATNAFVIGGESCQLSLSTTVDSDVSCYGLCDGAATLQVQNPNGNYVVNWSNGISEETPVNLCAGDYTITVTDDWGCTAEATVSINEPTVLQIDNYSSADVTCNGSSDASIQLSASGGTGTLSYDCNGTVQDNGSFQNLSGGSYTVIVSDENACSVSQNVNINEPSQIMLSLEESFDLSCNNSADGMVNVVASGGTLPLNYSLQGVSDQANGQFSNLFAGNYIVTITDDNGCSITSQELIVTAPDAIVVNNVNITDLTCFESGDGALELTVSGGTLPLNFSNNSATNYTGVFDQIDAGIYNVTISDANACTLVSGPHMVNEPDLLVIDDYISSDVTCYGLSDGSINISASGGSGNLNYACNGLSQMNGDFQNLTGGNYIVMVTDVNGCSVSQEVDISEPSEIVVDTEENIPLTCNGSDDGIVNMVATGGTGPLSFELAGYGVQDHGKYINLPAGSYTITVTDANGCSLTSQILQVDQPDAIFVNASDITDLTCYQSGDGALQLTASGGTDPLSYFNGMGTNQDGSFTNLNAGDYTVTISDANACTYIAGPYTINQPAELQIASENTDDLSCYESADGMIDIAASGGTNPLQFSMNGMTQNGGSFTQLSAGNYTVTITDAHQCSVISNILTVEQPQELIINGLSVVDVSCYNAGNGKLTVNASGGNGNFEYSTGVLTQN